MMIVPGASDGAEEHLLALVGAGELLLIRRRLVARLVDDVHVDLLRGGEHGGQEECRRRQSRGRSQPVRRNTRIEPSCLLHWKMKFRAYAFLPQRS